MSVRWKWSRLVLMVMAYLTSCMFSLSKNKQYFVCYTHLQRVKSDNMFLSYSGIFEINCSKDIKVQGIIGPCASLEKVSNKTVKGIDFSLSLLWSLSDDCLQKGPLCSDTAIGQGHTNAWKMCGLDKNTSICLVFEIAKRDTADVVLQSQSNQFYFQFLT